MTQHLIPHHSSPFDSIKQVEQGREYWSARDLQTLMRNAAEGDNLMKQHPRVLGIVPIGHYPTLVFSSESATEGTLHPGDFALL